MQLIIVLCLDSWEFKFPILLSLQNYGNKFHANFYSKDEEKWHMLIRATIGMMGVTADKG